MDCKAHWGKFVVWGYLNKKKIDLTIKDIEIKIHSYIKKSAPSEIKRFGMVSSHCCASSLFTSSRKLLRGSCERQSRLRPAGDRAGALLPSYSLPSFMNTLTSSRYLTR